MTRSRLFGLFAFCLVFVALTKAAAAAGITVDESKIRIDITDRAKLRLPVTNTTSEPVSGTLQLEFVNPHNTVLHDASIPVSIRPGATVLDVDISQFLGLEISKLPNYGWLRLRYRLSGDAFGIVSVSKIAPERFVMTVVRPHDSVASSRLRVQVFAKDHARDTPAASVQVYGRLAQDNRSIAQASSRTNSAGYAELDFQLPDTQDESDLALEVTGRLGAFSRVASDRVTLSKEFVLLPTTDKLIYQPGQNMRIRVLVFERLRKAAKGLPLKVSIEDPARDQVFKTSLTTSGFGESHTAWQIPENARRGTYQIQIESPDGTVSRRDVRVDHYDLPAFTIEVHQDRPYYVPGQNATVEISATYLFGKPVALAKARIVRELNRYWNYRQSRWEGEGGETIEGAADAAGRFHVFVNLDRDFNKIINRGGGAYLDLPYQAFATDSSTGKTEQSRFWIRISRNSIHLYILESHQVAGFPLDFYITASYADGRPAVCDVDIRESGEDKGPLAVVRTNKYGVAKVRGLTPSAEWWKSNRPTLALHARDADQGRGDTETTLEIREKALRLRTEKTLYRAGESILVGIESTRLTGLVALTALRDGQIIYSSSVRLVNGQSTVRVPASGAFHGDILLFAYDPEGVSDAVYAGRQISFPQPGLEIDSSTSKPAYSPGEEVTLSFNVRSPNGSPQESLLGITVLDKAVEERARSDWEIGNRYYNCRFCTSFLGVDSELAGLTRADLNRIDRSEPIAADLDLAAGVVLSAWNNDLNQPIIVEDITAPGEVFTTSLQSRLERLRRSDTYPFIFDLPRDEASLRAMVLRVDPDFDTLRDPWNSRYRLRSSVVGVENQIEVVSSGPDEQFPSPDDLSVGLLRWNYFEEYGRSIAAAMTDYHQRTGGYIRDIETLKRELRRNGQEFDAWRDFDGSRFLVEFGIYHGEATITIRNQQGMLWKGGTDYTDDIRNRIDAVLNQFTDRRDGIARSEMELWEVLTRGGISDDELRDPWGRSYYVLISSSSDTSERRMRAGPSEAVTKEMQLIRFKSAGPDGVEHSSDDFTAFSCIRTIKEQSTERAMLRIVVSPLADAAHGVVEGAIVDPLGGLIPGVSAKMIFAGGMEFDLKTDATGNLLVRDLDPGEYQIHLSMPGFQGKVMTGVIVRAGTATQFVSTLELSSLSTFVEVTTEAPVYLSVSSSSVAAVSSSSVMALSPRPITTPRLREYFPETLLWQPSLETTEAGKAQVRFNIADSVTTWKAIAIASTKDGRIAVAEKEFTSFQPLFIEHDLPKFLTEGDQIALPIVVRNYLDTDQSLNLTMQPEDWFTPADISSREFEIKAGEARREVFTFKALVPVSEGKQRLTASGPQASDAIQKMSTVYPFGFERTQTSSGILRSTSVHNFLIPSEAIDGSIRAELKIYPNLMAHVMDAIEGIVKRPYGCAEQVTSSAYPSLLLLRHYRQTGRKADSLSQKATGYLQIAVETLVGYQSSEGGFSYWANGAPDGAVTAYVLQFLTDATDFVAVGDLADDAREWLILQQSRNGSWKDDPILTAYIARVLSSVAPRKHKDAIAMALDYLQDQIQRDATPYWSASVALTALNSGDRQMAKRALDILRFGARREEGALYWPESMTPFYGWGLSGRLETTAVVLRALAAGGSEYRSLLDQGLLFLLRNKDRYGVWYSTQATVRVLEAMLEIIEDEAESRPGTADVLVNGLRAATVTFGTQGELSGPVIVDLSKFLGKGASHIEVVARGRIVAAAVELVENHYVPWSLAAPDLVSGPLRFSVGFDKHEASPDDEITVHVEAERIDAQHAGMLLAEIGLPPGAEVDRASLSAAMGSFDSAIARYDVLPDRVVAYLWPRAGSSTFDFKFRPRYGLDAHAPASKLYDYYNPEVQATIVPAHFVIR